jgi:hypothetical protein
MKAKTYAVLVGNIGLIPAKNLIEARMIYGTYKRQSIEGVGRAAGEPVTIFEDGEPLPQYDYQPPQSDFEG